ncbi:hypothetical protein EDC01DRAFT_631026 [Geopyxis carbonaria]|nr:hypothetical protein EDC01DRAFT_631026 [Geopyxis carbonaria]
MSSSGDLDDTLTLMLPAKIIDLIIVWVLAPPGTVAIYSLASIADKLNIVAKWTWVGPLFAVPVRALRTHKRTFINTRFGYTCDELAYRAEMEILRVEKKATQ